MQVVIDALLTHYQLSGSGKLVVILHGWGDNSHSFTNLQAALSTDFKVLRIDLPGFGETQAPPDVWGLDEYAGFVAALLKKLKLKDSYAIIGHSNGGAIAIKGLANGQLHAQRLILLASAGIRNQNSGRNKALKIVAKTGKTLAAPLPGHLKNSLRKRLYGAVGSDMLVAEHLQESFKKIVSDDIRNDAARLSIKTLLIYGDSDTATPPAYGNLLHKHIIGSTLLLIPGGGHFIHVDNEQRVLAASRKFLQ
jgi:pimeloyl-ACP methyl ester carboxylesterase